MRRWSIYFMNKIKYRRNRLAHDSGTRLSVLFREREEALKSHRGLVPRGNDNQRKGQWTTAT